MFNRDSKGNFINEQYATRGGGGDISPYEPRPSYQDVIKNIVGSNRGYPDVASDFCCAAIYLPRPVGRGRRHQLVFTYFCRNRECRWRQNEVNP